MPKLCVFPTDPIKAYYEKGEIKTRYFNPCNFFNEVHVVSLADEEVSSAQVQILAGDARLFIHSVGASAFRMRRPWALFQERQRILEIVREIFPDVIRGYNPLITGYYATYCGRKLDVPVVISLHGNYDMDHRAMAWRRKQYWYFSWLLLTSLSIEPYVLRNADKVICAYRWPVSYARRLGARDIEVIYNRVDLRQFRRPFDVPRSDRHAILCVGRLKPEKGQEYLVRAMQGLQAQLVLIGDGPQRVYLRNLVKELGLETQVTFIPSVPHAEIAPYYWQADIFAIANQYGGIEVPSLEAMAASLPVVVSKPLWEPTPEVIGDIALVVERAPDAFRRAFQQLLADPELQREKGEQARQRVQELDGQVMERKEMELYRDLLESYKRRETT